MSRWRCAVAEGPLVITVIPVFNGAAYVGEAIDSVLAQTYDPIRCVVVDDGSTDETPARLRDYGDAIDVVRQRNSGVSAARNAGAARQQSPFLAFLDADDCWHPERVEAQMALFAGRPELGLVYTGLGYVDGDGNPIGTQAAPPSGDALRNTLIMEPPVVSVSQAALVRRSAFEAVGGFDEGLSTSADCDLACKLALEVPIAAVDRPLTRYRLHEGQMHHDLEALERDMAVVFSRAFGDARLPSEIRALRARAYANLEYTLGASHARRRRAVPAARHLIRALRHSPVRVAQLVLRSGRRPSPAPRTRTEGA
jgi:glycosyltransferase involved in cell wall biosynthesis